jgi:hypothetical protein
MQADKLYVQDNLFKAHMLCNTSKTATGQTAMIHSGQHDAISCQWTVQDSPIRLLPCSEVHRLSLVPQTLSIAVLIERMQKRAGKKT